MKKFLKKLHMVPSQSEDMESSTSSKGIESNEVSSPKSLINSKFSQNPENKPLSGLSNWLNSVANRKSPSPPTSSNARKDKKAEPSNSVSSGGLSAALDMARRDSESSNSRDPDVEEEYQIQLAMELSAREDPEAFQIETVKQISLGSCAPENTPAEVLAYRYWNYNYLTYDDKILDGFYDVYGVLNESPSEGMPSLIDLQETPVSSNVSWEAVLINRAADANLLNLEQKALEMAVKSRSESLVSLSGNLVQKLALLVSDHMGGPVGDPDYMLQAWNNLSQYLRETHGSMVLPLGSLTIGLARHRALLFKVLADSIGIPCRLVKGQQYTGSSDGALNFIKVEDRREYIVDLMADPGALIPSDIYGSHAEHVVPFIYASPSSRYIDSSHVASSSSGVRSLFEEDSEEKRSKSKTLFAIENKSQVASDSSGSVNVGGTNSSKEKLKTPLDDFTNHNSVEKLQARELPSRPTYPFAHARSPSWTEGVSSPAVHRMKVKDVSQYMIDATKGNPQLAQKLHDVLLESGVIAPPNLFSEIYSNQLDTATVEVRSSSGPKNEQERVIGEQETKDQVDFRRSHFLPPLPQRKVHPTASSQHDPPVEGLSTACQFNSRDVALPVLPSPQPEDAPVQYARNVPVAAAAAAAAAVVASSMVVAAVKSNVESSFEIPVAAAATATAAAVVASAAAVSKHHELGTQSEGDADSAGCETRGSGGREHDAVVLTSEGERTSDRSAGNDSVRSDVALEDVAEYEIQWDEIIMGDRIGLGSYGEVYHGDWHGTEVAVKRFLDQDVYGDALEEFRSEVRIMKRLRHPNVVLFMGAVTRPPNLSIVTEFLPRGSLYRLLHRPNNQLDERRRLRMALDAARGMNYLHNCSPVIVHRDLKSPNLLVDKNWVVKVCDFGLSRMKRSTYLSSRSTAGTAEWMAPEVLRNEPSDEKCDVYSYGVILWELATLRQPWGGMNAMQVVGAVGFQHRRLEIPDNMDPAVAEIIRNCWETDPKLRPTFAEIMAALKPLQKPATNAQGGHRTGTASHNVQEKAPPQPSRMSQGFGG